MADYAVVVGTLVSVCVFFGINHQWEVRAKITSPPATASQYIPNGQARFAGSIGAKFKFHMTLTMHQRVGTGHYTYDKWVPDGAKVPLTIVVDSNRIEVHALYKPENIDETFIGEVSDSCTVKGVWTSKTRQVSLPFTMRLVDAEVIAAIGHWSTCPPPVHALPLRPAM
jgi:hypothetical protein